MKTTSLDTTISVAPCALSLVVDALLKKSDKTDILSEVEKIYQSNSSFQLFLKKFQLKDINHKSLMKAFIHSSFVNDFGLGRLASYERHELLGDSVLELIVTEKLLDSFTSLDEGAISKLRSQLVSKSELAQIAKSIGINNFILVGHGENQQQVYEKESVLADVFESLLGVIYQSMGLEKAKEYFDLICRAYESETGKIFLSLSRLDGKNFKGRLQELLMKNKKQLPKYTDVELGSGDFLVTVTIAGTIFGRDINKSKKQAQINAAKYALEKLTHQEKEILC